MRVPSPLLRSVPLAGSLALPGLALAQGTPLQNGEDINIDLMRPVWAPENLPGIDVPVNERGGSFRGGLTLMYTNSPLVLYEFDQEVGSVINNRVTAFAGMSFDVSRAFTVRVSMPFYYQFGTDVPKYASEGGAIGDLGVGGHFAFLRKPKTGLGIRLDLTAPTGRNKFYAGESLPVLSPGFLMMFDIGRVRIAADLGANIRFSPIDTQEDLLLGSELAANLGVRVHAIRERLDVGLSLYSRFGFSNFFGAGESSGEFLVNLAYRATPWLWVDLAGGRGFTRGYGASDVRVLANLRFQKVRKPLEEEEGFADEGDGNAEDQGGLKFNVRELQGIRAEGEGEAAKAEEWAEGQFAKIESERIKIRYAIRFKVGTDTILPESYETLDYLADLMNNDARIAHVIIEGHASEDGDFEPNYDLSRNRAASIWRRLVEQGVHPSRLSYRGMGEVLPAEATGGYDELQASRRVVFHIVRQYEAWEQPPAYDLDLKYPWTGEPYRAVQPRMPSVDEIANEAAGEPILRKAPERGKDEELKNVTFDEEKDEVEVDEAPAPAPTEEQP